MKALKFLGMCASFIGAVGGFGVAMHHKEYFIGVCILLLAGAAFPTVKKWVKELTS